MTHSRLKCVAILTCFWLVCLWGSKRVWHQTRPVDLYILEPPDDSCNWEPKVQKSPPCCRTALFLFLTLLSAALTWPLQTLGSDTVLRTPLLLSQSLSQSFSVFRKHKGYSNYLSTQSGANSRQINPDNDNVQRTWTLYQGRATWIKVCVELLLFCCVKSQKITDYFCSFCFDDVLILCPLFFFFKSKRKIVLFLTHTVIFQ